MATGTVKWFDGARGFGFIALEGDSKDLFVHISEVEKAGLSTLKEGQKVEFEVALCKNGKTQAEKLKAI